MEILRAALHFQHAPAIVAEGVTTRYLDLFRSSIRVCKALQLHGPRLPAEPFTPGPRVAIMADPGVGYTAGTLGTWLDRGIAVPLCLTFPDKALQYVLEDAGVTSVLATERHAERMYRLAQPFKAQVHLLDPLLVQQQGPADGGSSSSSSMTGSSGGGEGDWGGAEAAAMPEEVRREVESLLGGLQQEDGALIIYTSGTTGDPKGVLHTHRSVSAQVRTLCQAWRWAPSDRILHALPLHHVHGVVNALYCALAAGAAVEFMPKFSPLDAWQRLMREHDPVTVFMGVPTMYSFLLHKFENMPAEQQQAARTAAGRLRLTVSGSSACPLPVMSSWEALSGQRLLERYGMTETGMILGNPYEGERRPGTVGQPFQGVSIKLASKIDDAPGVGEVCVKSEQVFSHYWNKPWATAEAFDEDGYFRTGDTAKLSGDPAYYTLLGRTSVDIIKRGGEKVSALQIESVMLDHPDILECAVVGVPDPTYGDVIALLAVPKPDASAPLELPSLRSWAADRLPKFQLPSRLLVLESLPRNAMGKVNKKELRKLVPED